MPKKKEIPIPDSLHQIPGMGTEDFHFCINDSVSDSEAHPSLVTVLFRAGLEPLAIVLVKLYPVDM